MPDELDQLKKLGREPAEPDDESVARARERLERRIDLASAEPARPRRRLRLRWAAVAATLALLVGSGLGFGVGSWVTPTGSARGNVVGLGFIPADGWNVTQTGAIGETGVARAVAANVALDAGDDGRRLPLATLRELPAAGVVIAARFLPRGDAAQDERFPLSPLPLRVEDAVPVDLPRSLSGTSLRTLRLRAGADGYNVEARIFVHAPLSPARLAAVDEQLSRLVMAPSRVTLVVQPPIIASTNQPLSIFGSVDTGRSGQKVVVQFKACGLFPPQFRDAFETTTNDGGGYSLSGAQPLGPGVSGAFRAVAGDSVSADVLVQHRAMVFLRPSGSRRFRVLVSGTVPLWRRQVVLQRFARTRGGWVDVRRIVLANQLGGAGSAPPFQTRSFVTVESDPFRPGVRTGTQLRAVMPVAQARPCYIAGVSEVRRA